MRLKEIRSNKKVPQETLSRYADISLTHYQNIERGDSIPSVKIALLICELLKTSPYEVDEFKHELSSAAIKDFHKKYLRT